MSSLKISGLIGRHARFRSSHTAVVCDDTRLSYKEFNSRVNRLANLLLAKGVKKGERVATVLPNCVELLETYWATAVIGAVMVPLSPLLEKAGLLSLLNDASPKIVIASGKSRALLESVKNETPSVGVTGWVITESKSTGFGYLPELLEEITDRAPETEVFEDDIYNIMYTSGTTGLPKGIVHTHRIRALYGSLFAHTWRMSPESVVLHSGAIVFNGAFVTLMPCFLVGATYILHRQFDPAAFIETVKKEKVTHVMLVPTQIVSILNHPSFDPEALSFLEMILSLGAPLHVEHKKILEEALPNRFYELYGLTEGFITTLDRDDAVRKRGSVGIPLHFCEMKIVKEDGSTAKPFEAGEIVGRSPLMMPGYYKRPELTTQVLRDGWLATGDVGYVDDDGYLFLVDRKKDMIDSGGVKVYPKDIEEIIVKHPEVAEAAVFGVPHDKWGETPMAAAVLKTPGGLTPEALKAWINERVSARYQRVSDVLILDAFPRNTAGKVLKRELRDSFWKDRDVRI